MWARRWRWIGVRAIYDIFQMPCLLGVIAMFIFMGENRVMTTTVYIAAILTLVSAVNMLGPQVKCRPTLHLELGISWTVFSAFLSYVAGPFLFVPIDSSRQNH